MIARELENAIARYLTSCGDESNGGLLLFKTRSGAGEPLEVRTGHDDAGELPVAGFILVSVLDESVAQEVPLLNLYYVQAKVELVYPGHDNADDSSTLDSFDACLQEIQMALASPDIATLVSQQGDGVIVQGTTGGISFRSRINQQLREAEWTLPLAVNKALKLV